jgi:hypothetical protein
MLLLKGVAFSTKTVTDTYSSEQESSSRRTLKIDLTISLTVWLSAITVPVAPSQECR